MFHPNSIWYYFLFVEWKVLQVSTQAKMLHSLGIIRSSKTKFEYLLSTANNVTQPHQRLLRRPVVGDAVGQRRSWRR